jgi:hypothetical protein
MLEPGLPLPADQDTLTGADVRVIEITIGKRSETQAADSGFRE